MNSILRSVSGSAAPVAGIILGSVLGMHLKPSAKTVSGLKAFTAGIILAAVSTELVSPIAEVEKTSERYAVLLGITLGATVLVTMRSYFDKYDKTVTRGKIPYEMVTSIAVDFFIDALLIGIASTGSSVLSISLGMEMLVISLALSGVLVDSGVGAAKIYGVMGAMVGTIIVGIFIGRKAGATFKNSPVYYGMLAFGVAALVWLIMEELVVESQNGIIDARLQATLIFAGMTAIIISGWLGHQH